MYYKIPYKLIIIIVSSILAIGIIGSIIIFATSRAKTKNPNEKNEKDLAKVPVIEYDLSSEERNQKEVIVHLTVKTENKKGIDFVTLPDGTKEDADGEKVYETEFVATENKKYTVSAKGKNKEEAEITINIRNISESLAYVPYIPEGFHYVEGEPETGYVIEDDYNNQYVWVPVLEGKAVRNTSSNRKYQENDSSASDLVNSIAKNYGFYIARYEASKYNKDGEIVAASAKEKMPWTNVSFLEAKEAAEGAKEAFEYSDDYQTAVINSYAWDTVLDWLDTDYNDYAYGENYGNYSGEIRKTGETQSDIKSNICDLAGNVREWTTEYYVDESLNSPTNTLNTVNGNATNEVAVEEIFNYRILRGGSATVYATASSHTSAKENNKDNFWGFRLILYK